MTDREPRCRWSAQLGLLTAALAGVLLWAMRHQPRRWVRCEACGKWQRSGGHRETQMRSEAVRSQPRASERGSRSNDTPEISREDEERAMQQAFADVRLISNRLLVHELETPMRGHDEDGECCRRAAAGEDRA